MDENKEFENRPQDDGQPENPYIAGNPANGSSGGAPENPDTAQGSLDAGQNSSSSWQPPSGVPEMPQQPAATQFSGPDGYQPVPDGPATPPKKVNAGVIALVSIAVILVIAIIAVLVIGGLSKKPEEALRDAFSTTGARLQELSDTMMEEIPALRLMQPRQEGRSGTFQISINAFDTGDGSMEAQLFSSILKLFSLSGKTISDPDTGLIELSGNINMGSSSMLDYFFQASSDQIAFNIPQFSDTVLAYNPSTMVQDIKTSPLYNPYMDDESLQQMQDALTMQLKSLTSWNKLDAQMLQAEMYSILNEFLLDATYEKPQKLGDGTLYTVHLDGQRVKDTLIAFMKYVYIDSEISELYTESMREVFQEELIAPMENEMPLLPATMEVTVAQSGMISQLDFSVEVPESDGSLALTEMLGSYTIDENMGQTFTVNVGVTENGEPISVDMDVRCDYVDSVSKTSMTMKVAEEGTAIDMDVDMLFDQAGACDANMGVKVDASGDIFNLDMGMKGNVTEEEGTTRWEFPTMNFGYTMVSQGYSVGGTIGFEMNGESKALEGPAQPVSNVTPIFSMTAGELDAEKMKYIKGVQDMVDRFLIGDFSADTAETPAA